MLFFSTSFLVALYSDMGFGEKIKRKINKGLEGYDEGTGSSKTNRNQSLTAFSCVLVVGLCDYFI